MPINDQSGYVITKSIRRTNIAVLEPLYQSLTNYWNECPEDVLSSYGPEYLLQYKVKRIQIFNSIVECNRLT